MIILITGNLVVRVVARFFFHPEGSRFNAPKVVPQVSRSLTHGIFPTL